MNSKNCGFFEKMEIIKNLKINEIAENFNRRLVTQKNDEVKKNVLDIRL